MSNIIAIIITVAVRIVTLPLPQLYKKRVLAKIISKLDEGGTTEITTTKGNIKLHSLRGIYTVKRVEKFKDDEPELLEWINQFREGEIFWDIGSNIGTYSLYAGLNPKITVYSFEPSAFNFGLLVEHIKINNMGNRIKPFCMAFGDTTDITNLQMKDTHIGHARNLFENESQPIGYTPAFIQSTPVFSIDNFINTFGLTAPDHIKIDVDGAEAEILAGAINTLSNIQDIMIEVVGKNFEDVESLIEKPIFAAGLKEDTTIREKGSKRNRLYKR